VSLPLALFVLPPLRSGGPHGPLVTPPVLGRSFLAPCAPPPGAPASACSLRSCALLRWISCASLRRLTDPWCRRPARSVRWSRGSCRCSGRRSHECGLSAALLWACARGDATHSSGAGPRTARLPWCLVPYGDLSTRSGGHCDEPATMSIWRASSPPREVAHPGPPSGFATVVRDEARLNTLRGQPHERMMPTMFRNARTTVRDE
jgi:hypothetical protein